MGAHLARENNFWEVSGRRWLGDQLSDDPSTGIANLRPSVVEEIVQRRTANADIRFSYRLQFEDCFKGGLETDHRYVYDELQNPLVSLDLLGANIERGIQMAQERGLTPSIFNVGNWLWNGVQQTKVMWQALVNSSSYDLPNDGKGGPHTAFMR